MFLIGGVMNAGWVSFCGYHIFSEFHGPRGFGCSRNCQPMRQPLSPPLTT